MLANAPRSTLSVPWFAFLSNSSREMSIDLNFAKSAGRLARPWRMPCAFVYWAPSERASLFELYSHTS
jgi:hypothetical protein